MIRQNQKVFNLILMLFDALLCFVSMPLAYVIRFSDYFPTLGGQIELSFYLQMMLLAVPVYLLLYRAFELYNSYRRKTLLYEFGKILQANFFGITFLFVYSFLSKEANSSRTVMLLFTVINILLSTLLRFGLRKVLRAMRKRGKNLKHFVLVGWNQNACRFCRQAIANKNLGFYIDGYFENAGPQEFEEAVPWLGRLKEFEDYLAAHNGVDEVVISLDYEEYPLLPRLFEICEKEGVVSSLLPFFNQYIPARPHIEDFEGLPMINMRRIPLDDFLGSLLKRLFDLFGSLGLLLVLSPVMLATAIGVKLSSPGPIFYCQERIGRYRRPFSMYKFRSMKVDQSGADKTAWSSKTDDRRTKFGSFIRKYSIDELPQLWNVVRGEMSLVGPRPEIPFYVGKFKDEVPLYMLKHLVRPGITGLAQIRGWRGDTSIEERIKCDIDYIEHWTFLLDLKILLLTITRGVINKSEE